MVEKLIKYIITFIGLSSGVALGIRLADPLHDLHLINFDRIVYLVVTPTVLGLLGAFVLYFASKILIKLGKRLAQLVQNELEKIPQQDFLFGLIGLVFGLIIVFLISGLYDIIPIPMVASALQILTFVFIVTGKQIGRAHV